VLTTLPDAVPRTRSGARSSKPARRVRLGRRAGASIYHWRGSIETSPEVPLSIKTRADLFDAVAAAIRAAHPYELPEILAVPVCDERPITSPGSMRNSHPLKAYSAQGAAHARRSSRRSRSSYRAPRSRDRSGARTNQAAASEEAFRFSARALDAAHARGQLRGRRRYYLYRDKLRFSAATPAVTVGTVELPPARSRKISFSAR